MAIQPDSEPPLSTETMLPFHVGCKGTSRDIEMNAMYPSRTLKQCDLGGPVCDGFLRARTHNLIQTGPVVESFKTGAIEEGAGRVPD